MRIIKLHGTSGSGKSTVARQLMEWGQKWTICDPKIEAYRVDIEGLRHSIYVLGRYETACGGMDTLHADQQMLLINKYAEKGHIFFEGLLSSEYHGRLGALLDTYPDVVYAFLDTPVEICVERVILRRQESGNTKPFDPANTINRVEKIKKLQTKLTRLGKWVVEVDHTRAHLKVMELFKNAES